ncbi:MAG: diguanylate cyclase [Gammaproteobacteria bacterium]|nr:diguanylate cyclase [Gammaproteobacteria bacterium]
MDNFIKTATILYVEDEDKIREGFIKPINRCAKELFTASNGEEGLKLFKKHSPDIVVSDIKMPKMNGIDMIKAIKKVNPDIKIIITSAHSESKYLFNAIELHADAYYLKPVPSKLLKMKLKELSRTLFLEQLNSQQQVKIQEQEALLQNIIDTDKNISIVSDCNRIFFANKAFLNFFGIENIDQFNINNKNFLDVFEKKAGFISKELVNKTNLNNKNYSLSFYNLIQSLKDAEKVCLILDKHDKEKYFLISIDPMDKHKGLYLLTLTDITEITIQKTNAQIEANIDKLTGAFNRNKFEDIFNYKISKTKRHMSDLSIAILDIDHFKRFNDQYGHLVGDKVLKLLVQEIKKYTRKSDLFARWGGEEFIFIFSDTNINDAVKATNNLRKIIADMEQLPEGKITVSIGVTQYIDGDDRNSIFSRCDKALYLAKESGRNCVKSISEKMTTPG